MASIPAGGITLEAIGQMVDSARKHGYEEGMQHAQEKAREYEVPHQHPLLDQLKEMVAPGDLIVRKVNNGHIIRRVPYNTGMMVELWVVEGGVEEAAKQMTAIHAEDEMKRAQQLAGEFNLSAEVIRGSKGLSALAYPPASYGNVSLSEGDVRAIKQYAIANPNTIGVSKI